MESCEEEPNVGEIPDPSTWTLLHRYFISTVDYFMLHFGRTLQRETPSALNREKLPKAYRLYIELFLFFQRAISNSTASSIEGWFVRERYTSKKLVHYFIKPVACTGIHSLRKGKRPLCVDGLRISQARAVPKCATWLDRSPRCRAIFQPVGHKLLTTKQSGLGCFQPSSGPSRFTCVPS